MWLTSAASARRRRTGQGEKDPPRPPVGRGAHVLLAVAVAGPAGALGQEARELPGERQTGLRPALDATGLPGRLNTFGIDC